MFKALIDAAEAALSHDLLTSTLEAGAFLIALTLLAGFVFTRLARVVVESIGGALGDKMREEAQRRARTIVRRLGALATFVVLLGDAALTGYAIYFQKDLAHAILRRATPERFYEVLRSAAFLVGFVVLAAVLNMIVGRVVRWIEARVLASGLDVDEAAIKPVTKSLSSLAKVVIYIEALLLALELAGVPEKVVDPVRTCLKLAAIVLGAMLSARIAHLLLDAVGTLLASAPEKGAFRYLLRMRGLVSLGKRSAEYVIYAYAAKSFVVVLGAFQEIGVLGERVISTIVFALAARVVIELVALVIHDVFIGQPAEETTPAAIEAEARARTFVPILRSLAAYFIYFFAGLSILKVWGVDTGPILASAGILGLAVGLGAQKLTGDLVAGFFILFEGTYFVGHYVVVGDKEGTVESISIRTTSIRDEKGVLHTIPNGSVNVVSNFSTGFVDAVVDVALSYKTDLTSATKVMVEIGTKLRDASPDVLAPTQVEGLIELNASDAVLRTRTRVRPGRHEWAKCELRRRIKDAFDAEKIELKALKD